MPVVLRDCCRTLVGTGHKDCKFLAQLDVAGTMPGAPVCEHCGQVFVFTTAGQLHHPLPHCPGRLAREYPS